jgi:hypothetical protein
MTQEQPQPSFNPWQYKPWWCQPWSIVLTAAVLITGSWLLFASKWITAIVAVPVLAWAIFFVGIWPRLMAQIYTADTEPKSS